jgi:hypothetical protein
MFPDSIQIPSKLDLVGLKIGAEDCSSEANQRCVNNRDLSIQFGGNLEKSINEMNE